MKEKIQEYLELAGYSDDASKRRIILSKFYELIQALESVNIVKIMKAVLDIEYHSLILITRAKGTAGVDSDYPLYTGSVKTYRLLLKVNGFTYLEKLIKKALPLMHKHKMLEIRGEQSKSTIDVDLVNLFKEAGITYERD